MCGRLLVGKSKRRVALLVGAALYALEGVLVGARSSSRVMMALRRELLVEKKWPTGCSIFLCHGWP